MLEDVLCADVGSQVHPGRNRGGAVPRIILLPAKICEDLLILRRYGHRIVCINAVLPEMVWKSTKEELVENTALLDIEVVRDFIITPVR